MLSGNDIQRSYEYRDLAHVCFGAMTFPLTKVIWWGIGLPPLSIDQWKWVAAACCIIGFMGGYFFLEMSRSAQRRHFQKLRESGVSQVTQTGRFFK